VPPASAIPGRDTFWMTATGTLLRAPDAAVARALASEWASTDAAAGAAAGVFGPVRYGQSVVRRGAGADRVWVAATR